MSLNTRIHWINPKFYSVKSFISEVKERGISREVSLSTAKILYWGEKIWLIGKDNSKSSKGIIFGYFFTTMLKYSSYIKSEKIEKEMKEMGIIPKKIEKRKALPLGVLPEDLDLLSRLYISPPNLNKRGCSFEKEETFYLQTTSLSLVKKYTMVNHPLGEDLSPGLFYLMKNPLLMKIEFFKGFKKVSCENKKGIFYFNLL